MDEKTEVIAESDAKFKQYEPLFNILYELGIQRHPFTHYYLCNYPPRLSANELSPDEYTSVHNAMFSNPGNNQSLYVHIPYCKSICTFCNFYVIPNQDIDSALERHVDLLIKQADIAANQSELSVNSVLYGGGTPSLLNPEQAKKLLKKINQYFSSNNAQTTFELNPEIVKSRYNLDEYLNMLKEHGVNRVSIGIQSFNDTTLRKTSRGHTSTEAQSITEMILNHGFLLNIDMMYGGLYGQNLDNHYESLKKAFGSNADTVTVYPTYLKHGIPDRQRFDSRHFPSFQDRLKMGLMNLIMAEKYSRRQEMTDWFVRKDSPGFKVNDGKWGRHETFMLTLGPGSYGWNIKPDNGLVYFTPFNLGRWEDMIESGGHPFEKMLVLSKSEAARRHFMFNIKHGLLRKASIDALLEDSDDKIEIQTILSKLNELELMNESGDGYYLSESGYLLADEIACTLASDRILQEIIRQKSTASLTELKHEMFPDSEHLMRFKQFLLSN